MIDNYIARPIKYVWKQCAQCGGEGIIVVDSYAGVDIKGVCDMCDGKGEIKVKR